MKFVKRLIIMSGDSNKGTLSFERNAYGVFGRLRSFGAPMLSGELVMRIDGKVFIQPLSGESAGFTLACDSLDAIHAACFSGGRLIMYGTNEQRRLSPLEISELKSQAKRGAAGGSGGSGGANSGGSASNSAGGKIFSERRAGDYFIKIDKAGGDNQSAKSYLDRLTEKSKNEIKPVNYGENDKLSDGFGSVETSNISTDSLADSRTDIRAELAEEAAGETIEAGQTPKLAEYFDEQLAEENYYPASVTNEGDPRAFIKSEQPEVAGGFQSAYQEVAAAIAAAETPAMMERAFLLSRGCPVATQNSAAGSADSGLKSLKNSKTQNQTQNQNPLHNQSHLHNQTNSGVGSDNAYFDAANSPAGSTSQPINQMNSRGQMHSRGQMNPRGQMNSRGQANSRNNSNVSGGYGGGNSANNANNSGYGSGKPQSPASQNSNHNHRKSQQNGKADYRQSTMGKGDRAEKISKNPHVSARQGTFYERNGEEIERLMSGPREAALEKLLPGSRWVKIDYDQTGKHYVVGVIGQDYLCYGVPAKFSPQPPEELDGYCWWLPIDAAVPEGKGYWVMYQSMLTGQTVYPRGQEGKTQPPPPNAP